MPSPRIAFAGTPEFALPALKALTDSPYQVVGVLTQPDRPSGRGRKVTASPVKVAALGQGLPVSQPPTLKSETGRAELVSWQPDVLVVVAYGLILPGEVLTLPRLGCLNIHASLLPRWRGAAPIQRAILAGDAETGITIMQMDAGLDTGAMLLQRRVPIAAEDTSGSLHDRLAELGASALMEVLEGLLKGTVTARPQPSDGVTYAAKIDKAEARIDWRQDALGIERKIRALNPRPGAETLLGAELVKIHAARLPKPSEEEVLLSSIPKLGLHEGAIWVRCGEGILGLTRLQRPGRRPVSAQEFAHGTSLTTECFR